MNNLNKIRKNGHCERMREILFKYRDDLISFSSLEGSEDLYEVFKEELEIFDSVEDFLCSICDHVKPSDAKDSFLLDERTIILDTAVGKNVFHPIDLIEKHEPEVYRKAVEHYWENHIKNRNIVQCCDTYFYTDELIEELEGVRARKNAKGE